MDTKTLCLAVLSMGDASGYEIRKKVEEVFSRFVDVAPSGIYGALKQLDQEGFVSATVVPQEGRPNKTVYTLLAPGKDALVSSLRASEGRHRIRSELVALLMFADLLPADKLRDVLDNRIAELERVREEMDTTLVPRGPGQKFLIGMGKVLVETELAFLRENVPALLADLDVERKQP